ncbi:LexA family transcriptional regulator [Rhizobium sp. 11515TR]|uniref:LexA family transcriptional regulator n=1 Tax=Rhizobium sp. 11515TR TaxID=2028343 RepID=UPI000BA84E7C|nr:S24 family peptidase [Rhizobium sp. 11515TR]ASW06271.1 hypothetical protein CKA34_10500 [Rhizobium sp. 11515TR]
MKRYDYVSLLKGFKKIGLKQDFVASEIGVAQASISRWTTKDSEPSIDNYFAIVDLARQHGLITEDDAGESPPERNLNLIDEIDIFAGLGGGGLSIIESTATNGITFHRESVRDQWRLPDSVLNRFNARPNHIKAFPSKGNSMVPMIQDGDVVFADTRHRVPSPPGVYVLADQFGGVVVKKLQVISRPADDPVIVRISSENADYEPQELTLDEIQIIGMYVGRFTVN